MGARGSDNKSQQAYHHDMAVVCLKIGRPPLRYHQYIIIISATWNHHMTIIYHYITFFLLYRLYRLYRPSQSNQSNPLPRRSSQEDHKMSVAFTGRAKSKATARVTASWTWTDEDDKDTFFGPENVANICDSYATLKGSIEKWWKMWSHWIF